MVKGDLVGLSEEMLTKPVPDDALMGQHLSQLRAPRHTDKERLGLLRALATSVRYSAKQARAVLGAFHHAGEDRVQAAIFLFPHIPASFKSVVDILSR